MFLFPASATTPLRLYLDESGTLGFGEEVFTMAMVLVNDLARLEACIARNKTTQAEIKASQMKTAQKLALARTLLEENDLQVFLLTIDPAAALACERKLDKELLYDSMIAQAMAYYLQRGELPRGMAYRLSLDMRGGIRESFEDMVRESIGNVLMHRDEPLVADLQIRYMDSKYSAGVQAADLFSNIYRTALSQDSSPCNAFLHKFGEAGAVHAGFAFGLPELADQMSQIAADLRARVEFEAEHPGEARAFRALPNPGKDAEVAKPQADEPVAVTVEEPAGQPGTAVAEEAEVAGQADAQAQAVREDEPKAAAEGQGQGRGLSRSARRRRSRAARKAAVAEAAVAAEAQQAEGEGAVEAETPLEDAPATVEATVETEAKVPQADPEQVAAVKEGGQEAEGEIEVEAVEEEPAQPKRDNRPGRSARSRQKAADEKAIAKAQARALQEAREAELRLSENVQVNAEPEQVAEVAVEHSAPETPASEQTPAEQDGHQQTDEAKPARTKRTRSRSRSAAKARATAAETPQAPEATQGAEAARGIAPELPQPVADPVQEPSPEVLLQGKPEQPQQPAEDPKPAKPKRTRSRSRSAAKAKTAETEDAPSTPDAPASLDTPAAETEAEVPKKKSPRRRSRAKSQVADTVEAPSIEVPSVEASLVEATPASLPDQALE